VNLIVKIVLAIIPGQWGKDLAKVLQLLSAIMDEQEKTGAPGPDKKKAALAEFFDEVEKPGGVDLPTIMTGPHGRRFIGALIDGLIALSKGEEGNS
jgi:hypothetical protein